MKKILAAALLCLFLAGCGAEKTENVELQKYDVQFFDVFDTVSAVSVYAENQEQADEYTNAVHDRLLYLHQQFDPYNTYEEYPDNLKALNDKAGTGDVSQVSNDLYEVLEKGKEVYDITDGKINIAMGATLELWHKYRDDALDNGNAAIPTAEELEETRQFNDISALELLGQSDNDNKLARITKAGTAVNLGAIAKGYSASEAIKLLKDMDCDSALINLGGNVACYRGNAKQESWKVGIQDPQNPDSLLDVVQIDSGHLVSSGDYQRYYIYDGKKIHHIIDPDTLMPAENHTGTTVIMDGLSDGFDADMLSTALFILPDDDGRALAEKYENVQEIYLISPDGRYEKYDQK